MNWELDWINIVLLSLVFLSATYLVVSLVNASNASLNSLSEECSANKTVNTFNYKGALIKEVYFNEPDCRNRIAGQSVWRFENKTISRFIFLNANQSDMNKAGVLRHEYCHWSKGDLTDSFWEELECNIAELNVLNYI